MRVCAICFSVVVCLLSATALADDKFTPIFNGKDLEGWDGDPGLWKVVDGVLIGSTEGKDLGHNSFLATKKSYKNFVLKVKFKLRNHNSGIQYRSKQESDYVVKGYQADIADNAFMGILYEEGGRGIRANVKPEEVAQHINKDGWNEYVITADGPHLKQELNGFTTVDYTEEPGMGATEGIIALQLHAGPKMQIEFKDIEIRELP
jgi:hypothetical protein